MLQKYSSFKFLAFLLSLIIVIQFGCKKADDIKDPSVLEPPVITNDAVKVTATISGSVLDENNQPVANAIVTSGTYTSGTDAMGNFVFKNVNISAANGHVTVIKTGYFKGIRSFVTEAGKNNFVKIQLIKQALTATITASVGGTVTTSAATISFPANAFVTAGGAVYSGSVKVYATWIDPTAANLPLVVPGDLRGINSSNGEFLLKSYGMVGAELQDNSGNHLKIAPGKTATITFPIMGSLQGTAPGSIPLWHFDEATARWKEEGSAVKNGNTYTAQVNKFSFWNVDVPGNFVNLDLRLLNSANNLPLANTLVKITSLTNGISAYDHTNDSGFVSGYVPKNENLKLEVIAGTACNTSAVIHTQNIGPYSSNTSLGNINVTIPANQVITFTGTVKGCNNLPVTNGYVSLVMANGTGTIAYTNATGQVNFSLVYCGGSTAYTYNAVDLSNGNYSTTASGTASGNAVNLGTIIACGNTINTNGVYIAGGIANNAVFWKDGIPTFLTNIPAGNVEYAYAAKVLVYNNDVYVLGVQDDSTINGWVSTIKLWKNGVVTNITNGTTEAEAYSFDVFNGDVYISGTEQSGNNPQISKVWKNGVATILPVDTFNYAEPGVIRVVNGDVYVSGTLYLNVPGGGGGGSGGGGSGPYSKRALYWKNGIINILPTAAGTNTGAAGLFINNADIYLTGHENANGTSQISQSVYWRNGIKTTLALLPSYTTSDAYFMYVDNNDVYIAGNQRYQDQVQNIYYSNATYWKNNSVNLLTNSTTTNINDELYDIFVKNNIVYSVGETYGNSNLTRPLYFQNNVAVPLTGFTATQDAFCYSVFVK